MNLLDEAGEPLVLEAVSARVRAGPLLLPLLTIACVRARVASPSNRWGPCSAVRAAPRSGDATREGGKRPTRQRMHLEESAEAAA